MSYTKIFIQQFYEFNKKEFWLIVAANIILGLVINILNVHAFIQAAVVIILALKSFSFLRGSSVMPSISSDFDRYSWKYFQGLPLSKRELIVALVVSNFISQLPLYVWFVAFYPQVAGIFMEENAKVDLSVAGKIFLALLPILFIVSLGGLINQIIFPRKQYSKVEAKVKYLNFIKNASIGLACLLYFFMAYDWFEERYNFNLGPYLLIGAKFAWGTVKSWFLAPILALLAVHIYHNIIKVWQDEKKAYSNIKWVPKKDIPITAFAITMLALPVMNHDWDLPAKYSGSKAHAAVYHHNYEKLVEVTKDPASVNIKNKFGFTPLMLAARRGNLAFYQYLKKKGASNEGAVRMKGSKESYDIFYLAVKGGNVEIVKDLISQGYSANAKFDNKLYSSPVHLASELCHPQMVDLLIENKADLSVVNAKGQTALHISAQRRCFGAVTSLIEAGINPMVKDKLGSLAVDYVKDAAYTKDLAYYIEKKSRAPASQK